MQIQSPQIVTNLTVSGSFSLTAEATGSLINQITGSLNTLYLGTGSIDLYTSALASQLFT